MKKDISNAESFLIPLLLMGGDNLHYEEVLSTRGGTRYIRIRAGINKYFAKQFLVSNELKENPRFLRRTFNKNPLGFEYSLLKVYNDNGANVPRPVFHSPELNTLIMEDFGEDTLEKRLLGASEKRTMDLLNQTLIEMINFHKIARQHQAVFLNNNPLGILKTSRLVERALNYYSILLLERTELLEGVKPKLDGRTDLVRYFNGIAKELLVNSQPIHGDMSTYHVFFRPKGKGEEACFIDFGNPKFASTSFDVGDLLFSPGIYLSLENKLEVLDEYVVRANQVPSRNILYKASKDILFGERRRLCFAGIFECLRRAARDREARIKYPKQSEYFVRKHPAYENPLPHYADTSKQLLNFLIVNSDRYKLNKEEIKSLTSLNLVLGKAFAGAEESNPKINFYRPAS